MSSVTSSMAQIPSIFLFCLPRHVGFSSGVMKAATASEDNRTRRQKMNYPILRSCLRARNNFHKRYSADYPLVSHWLLLAREMAVITTDWNWSGLILLRLKANYNFHCIWTQISKHINFPFEWKKGKGDWYRIYCHIPWPNQWLW